MRLCVLALSALLAAPALSQQASGAFDVRITLRAPDAAAVAGCVSRSLNLAPDAVVEVACPAGGFVSIDAKPGGLFTGTPGAAFRFLEHNATPRPGEPSSDAGLGTVTGLFFSDVAYADQPLEVLIVF